MIDKTYYKKMLGKGRLIPLIEGDRLGGLITFYICNEGEEDKYLRDNMWSVEEDNHDGNCCYIDHLITDHDPNNPKLSYRVWYRFKKYIRHNFPAVKKIKWNRFNEKTNRLTIRTKLYNPSIGG
jgi:hypothetical protein